MIDIIWFLTISSLNHATAVEKTMTFANGDYWYALHALCKRCQIVAYCQPVIYFPSKTTANLQLLYGQPLKFYLLNHEPHILHHFYFLIDDALRLRSSVFLAFSSLTRLARMEAYSFCNIRSVNTLAGRGGRGSVPQHPLTLQLGDA